MLEDPEAHKEVHVGEEKKLLVLLVFGSSIPSLFSSLSPTSVSLCLSLSPAYLGCDLSRSLPMCDLTLSFLFFFPMYVPVACLTSSLFLFFLLPAYVYASCGLSPIDTPLSRSCARLPLLCKTILSIPLLSFLACLHPLCHILSYLTSLCHGLAFTAGFFSIV